MKRERICGRRSARWHGCERRSMRLIVASIIMSVLFLTGCASKKHQLEVHEELKQALTKDVKMDSVTEESLTVTMEPVAAESATMAIPINVIEKLPEGAEYRKRSGRIAVSARRKGFDLSIEAQADSMPRLREEHKCRRVSKSREAVEEKDHATQSGSETEVEGCSNGVKMVFVILATGLLLWLMVRIGIKNRLTNDKK